MMSTRVFRPVWDFARFPKRKRIKVGTQKNRWPGFLAFHHTGNAESTHPGDDLTETNLDQSIGDKSGRRTLTSRALGHLMEAMSKPDQVTGRPPHVGAHRAKA